MSNGNKRKYKAITKHSTSRAKQRLGGSKNSIGILAKRAREDGLTEKDVYGDLLHELLSHARPIRKIYYYANAFYIFSTDGALITVMNKNSLFDKELYKYTTYPIFIKYTQNRYKHTKNKEKMNEILDAGHKYLIEQINNLLKPFGGKCKSLHEETCTAYLVYDMDIPFNTIQLIYKRYGISFKNHNDQPNIVTPSKFDKIALIKDWFLSTYDMSVKVNYVDNKFAIFRVAETSNVQKITPAMKDYFKTVYNLIPLIWNKGEGFTVNTLVPEKFEDTKQIIRWFKQNTELNPKILDITDENVIIDLKVSEEIKSNFYNEFKKTLTNE